MVTVLSLGGSIVAPDGVDSVFVKDFRETAVRYLCADERRRLIIVVGGGGLARRYQAAYRDIAASPLADAQDWIGIAATRVNAQLLAGVFADLCADPVVIDPSAASTMNGRVLIGAGWKPGFSTDYDAVVLAERFQADTVINLSNVAKVYTADPRLDSSARPIDSITWADFRSIVGDEWTPGRNMPFDPVASRRAAELGLRVVMAAGKDLDNLSNLLEGRGFTGTVIGPR